MINVSIIVPCYNQEKYIDNCMDSLLHQTLDNIEIILVNDASKDSTLEIVRKYEAEYEHVVVVDSKVNVRPGGARNLGMDIARGKYIGFVDPDDWVDETMFEKLYRLAEEHNYDMTTSYTARINKTFDGAAVTIDDDIVIAEQIEGGKQAFYQKSYEIKPGSGKVLFSVWDSIYKREFLEKNAIRFPEKIFYEDGVFRFLADYLKQSQGIVEEVLYYYLINDTSVSSARNDVSVYENLLVSLEDLVREIRERGLLKKHRAEIEKYFIMRYYHGMYMLLGRFSKPPIVLLKKLSQFMLKHFPNYQRNIHYRDGEELNTFVLEILALNDTDPKQLWKLIQSSKEVREIIQGNF